MPGTRGEVRALALRLPGKRTAPPVLPAEVMTLIPSYTAWCAAQATACGSLSKLRLRLTTLAPSEIAYSIASATAQAFVLPSESATRSGRTRASGLIRTIAPATAVPCPNASSTAPSPSSSTPFATSRPPVWSSRKS